MKLLQRLRNLWVLSSLIVVDEGDRVSIENNKIVIEKEKEEYKHRPPVIIKRTTPVENFLNKK